MGSAADVSAPWSEAPATSRRPPLGTVLLVFLAVSMTLAVVGTARRRASVVGRPLRLPARGGVGAARRTRRTRAPRPDPRGSEGIRLSAAARARAPSAHRPSDAGRRGGDRGRRPARAPLLTLRMLGIRDVRCYAAALLWVPSVSGVLLGNLSIPLAFAAAVAWRYRDRVWPPAWALGLAISAKLLMWPLLVWTLATRRLRVTVWARGHRHRRDAGRVGGDRLRRAHRLSGSPQPALRHPVRAELLVRRDGVDGRVSAGRGGRVLDARSSAARCSSAASLLARRGDDPRSFTCAIAATLALSPIVWLHYLVVAARADGDHAAAVLGDLAATRPPLGQPEARLRGGSR